MLALALWLAGCPAEGPGPGPGGDACTEIGCEDGFTIEVAYISAIYEPGLVINVYDGEQMVWPNTELPVIDPSPSYVDRFGPQWAPDEGTIHLAYANGGMRYRRITTR